MSTSILLSFLHPFIILFNCCKAGGEMLLFYLLLKLVKDLTFFAQIFFPFLSTLYEEEW